MLFLASPPKSLFRRHEVFASPLLFFSIIGHFNRCFFYFGEIEQFRFPFRFHQFYQLTAMLEKHLRLVGVQCFAGFVGNEIVIAAFEMRRRPLCEKTL